MLVNFQSILEDENKKAKLNSPLPALPSVPYLKDQDAYDQRALEIKQSISGLRRVRIGLDGDSYVRLINKVGRHG